MSWQDDLGDSASAFKNVVYPKVKDEFFGEGELVSVEETHSPIADDLDMDAGIDFYHKGPNGVVGIANRVQWGNAWNTFTVRNERKTGATTEFEKRTSAVENQSMLPDRTVQSYVADVERDERGNIIDGTVLSSAMCHTKDLYDYLSAGEHGERHEVEQGDKDYYSNCVTYDGAATFYVVRWQDFHWEHDFDYYTREVAADGGFE